MKGKEVVMSNPMTKEKAREILKELPHDVKHYYLAAGGSLQVGIGKEEETKQALSVLTADTEEPRDTKELRKKIFDIAELMHQNERDCDCEEIKNEEYEKRYEEHIDQLVALTSLPYYRGEPRGEVRKETIKIIDEMLNEHSRYEKGIPMTADWLKCRADSINAIVSLTTPKPNPIDSKEQELIRICKEKGYKYTFSYSNARLWVVTIREWSYERKTFDTIIDEFSDTSKLEVTKKAFTKLTSD